MCQALVKPISPGKVPEATTRVPVPPWKATHDTRQPGWRDDWPGPEVRYLDAADTRASLPMDDAIAAMRVAFTRDRETPQRQTLGSSLFMSGRVEATTGMKVVSTMPGNPVGIVAVFDTDGTPVGIVDGPTLTAIRTGAVSGLATDLLAEPRSGSLAMLGAGEMARDQIAAVRAVREIDQILIWSRGHERAQVVASDVGGRAISDANEAAASADIIVTATPARSPLFDHQVLRQTVHINAIGAFTPAMVEVPAETVAGSYVVVDDYDAASQEAGDLLSANRVPDIDLTELLETAITVHRSKTLFKSVGIASQDIAAAHVALMNAQRMGLGVEL